MGHEAVDYICRWCGVEVVLVTSSFSDPSAWSEEWFHREGSSANVSLCENDAGTSAEPTVWEEAG